MYILGWEEERLFLIFTLEIVIAIVSIPLSDRIEDIESIIHKHYRGENTILHTSKIQKLEVKCRVCS